MLHVWSLLSSGSFVLMPPLDHVELLSVDVLLGLIGKGTSPGACRVAANNAA